MKNKTSKNGKLYAVDWEKSVMDFGQTVCHGDDTLDSEAMASMVANDLMKQGCKVRIVLLQTGK